MYELDGQMFDIGNAQVVGDVQYPAHWFDDADRRAAAGIHPVTPTAPSFDAATQDAVEIAPQEIDGVWVQQWQIVDLSAPDIAARALARKAAIMVQIVAIEDSTLENRGEREFHIQQIISIATEAAPGLGRTADSILAANPYYQKLVTVNNQIVALRTEMEAL